MSEPKPEPEQVPMERDPILEAALDDVRTVLEKHRVAAFIIKTSMDAVVVIKTKKSVAQTEVAMHGLTFRNADEIQE